MTTTTHPRRSTRCGRPVLAWPVDSQHSARRNALVASTALAQLRHERARGRAVPRRARAPAYGGEPRPGAAPPGVTRVI